MCCHTKCFHTTFTFKQDSVIYEESACQVGFGLTQSVTGLIFPGADVQASEKDSVVVPFAALPHQTRLPLTETVEGLISVMIYGQTQLEVKAEMQQ